MSAPPAQEIGFLKLFDPDGNEVDASMEDLLSIEAMSFDKAVHRRVAGDRSGRYWLISNRPGLHAMLLQVNIFHCYPREEDHWEISYCTNGIASFPHFELEPAIRMFSEERWSVEPDDRKALPSNVAELARAHVAYRLGRTPGPDPLDLHGVRTRDAADMRRLLEEFTEHSIDCTQLLKDVAGKRVAIFELMLVITFFCGEHGLDGREADLINIIVPEDQHDRLHDLLGNLKDQLGSE